LLQNTKKTHSFRTFFLLRFMRLTRTWRTKNNSKTTKNFALSERVGKPQGSGLTHKTTGYYVFVAFSFLPHLTSLLTHCFSMFFFLFPLLFDVHNTPSSSCTLLTYSNCAKEFLVQLLLLSLLLNENNNKYKKISTHNWVKKSPLARLSWWIFSGFIFCRFYISFCCVLGCCF
jgi:hypothetical protein